MTKGVPSKQELRNLLCDFAVNDLYVVFSYDYEDNVLNGMKITGDGLRLQDLLNYLREHGVPILSVEASPVKREHNTNDWVLWWDILFMRYSTEN